MFSVQLFLRVDFFHCFTIYALGSRIPVLTNDIVDLVRSTAIRTCSRFLCLLFSVFSEFYFSLLFFISYLFQFFSLILVFFTAVIFRILSVLHLTVFLFSVSFISFFF